MTFDLRIITVGYGEPTLWAAILVTSVVAVAAGIAIGKRFGRRALGPPKWATGAAVGLLLALALVVIAHLLFSVLFSVATDGAMVCTYIVGPALLLPAAVALLAQAIAWWVTARRIQHAV